jgi:hypothetical protein
MTTGQWRNRWQLMQLRDVQKLLACGVRRIALAEQIQQVTKTLQKARNGGAPRGSVGYLSLVAEIVGEGRRKASVVADSLGVIVRVESAVGDALRVATERIELSEVRTICLARFTSMTRWLYLSLIRV